jgi:hypothetical protein
VHFEAGGWRPGAPSPRTLVKASDLMPPASASRPRAAVGAVHVGARRAGERARARASKGAGGAFSFAFWLLATRACRRAKRGQPWRGRWRWRWPVAWLTAAVRRSPRTTRSIAPLVVRHCAVRRHCALYEVLLSGWYRHRRYPVPPAAAPCACAMRCWACFLLLLAPSYLTAT